MYDSTKKVYGAHGTGTTDPWDHGTGPMGPWGQDRGPIGPGPGPWDHGTGTVGLCDRAKSQGPKWIKEIAESEPEPREYIRI